MRAGFTVISLAVVLLTAGCQGTGGVGAGAGVVPEQRAVESPAQAARIELSADAQTLYRRTLVRDGAPSCAELTAGLGDPTRALLEVSERVIAPGSSSIRAATCLLRSDAAREVEPQLARWVRTRATMGLGLLALNYLDALEEGLATRLVESALAGEFADEARERIARSTRYPALRARAGGPAEPAGTTAPAR